MFKWNTIMETIYAKKIIKSFLLRKIFQDRYIINFISNYKKNRLKNLLLKQHTPNNEAISDSYLDVSNYGIMAMIVKAKKLGIQIPRRI